VRAGSWCTCSAVCVARAIPHIGVVGLKPSVSFDTYLDNMATVLFSQDDEAKARAGQAVQRDTAVGGGVRQGGQSTIVLLTPGTYYLVDYTSLGRPNPVNHWQTSSMVGRAGRVCP
jgi:hypothetical protein